MAKIKTYKTKPKTRTHQVNENNDDRIISGIKSKTQKRVSEVRTNYKSGKVYSSVDLNKVKRSAFIENINKDTISKLYRNPSNANSYFKNLLRITKLPIKILAKTVFEVTPKTFSSYLHSDNILPIRIQELSIKLNELYAKGNLIFGSVNNFNEWMNKDSFGLEGMKPIELINTITGMELILDELVSIEFGTTA